MINNWAISNESKSLEFLKFLERIQWDRYDLIHLSCGPFHYFLVLIDASIRRSDVSLLSSCGITFPRFLAQTIRLRAKFLDCHI